MLHWWEELYNFLVAIKRHKRLKINTDKDAGAFSSALSLTIAANIDSYVHRMLIIKSNILVDINDMVIMSLFNIRRLRIFVVRSAQCLLSLVSNKFELTPDNELHCPIIEIPVTITLPNICERSTVVYLIILPEL